MASCRVERASKKSKPHKRNDLTLALKYEVVKTAEREKKLGVRKLSEMFGCGKTQISVILRNKERIKELYETTASGKRCQTGKRFRESKFSQLNDTLYSWYLLAVSKISIQMDPNCLKRQEK